MKSFLEAEGIIANSGGVKVQIPCIQCLYWMSQAICRPPCATQKLMWRASDPFSTPAFSPSHKPPQASSFVIRSMGMIMGNLRGSPNANPANKLNEILVHVGYYGTSIPLLSVV
jgi:hypothetical protein